MLRHVPAPATFAPRLGAPAEAPAEAAAEAQEGRAEGRAALEACLAARAPSIRIRFDG